jgi:hypothetical protein
MKLLKSIILVILFLSVKNSFSQSHFQLQWQYDYTTLTSPWSLNADVLSRPYLYAASGESGLRIFTTAGVPVFTVDTNMIEMSAMNYTQVGNLLYIAIGRHSTDLPGLAIVDVTNPAAPVVKDVWVHPPVSERNGSGIVKVEGNYAYLGAMGRGLIILNISDPNNIAFVSELALSVNYPVASPPPNPDLYNLRGMQVKNSIVYACFDAGGLRIINCVDKLNPKQTGKYANPVTYVPNNQPRAYNNIVLNDTVAYVAVDYCGLEVLRISDTSNITLLDHWNIHNCPTGSWFDAPVHANELEYNDDCKELFMTTGKSEMISMDVSDPMNVDSTGMYGSLSDTTATWGIGMRNDSIFLSYVLIPFYISWLHPFNATWNGIKMIKWVNPCAAISVEENERNVFSLRTQPNPFKDETQILFKLKEPGKANIRIFDMVGHSVTNVNQQFQQGDNFFNWNGKDMTGNECPSGMYFLSVEISGQILNTKLLKSN